MDETNEESTTELDVARPQPFTFNLDLGAGDTATALTVPQKQELASLAQRQKIELAADVASRQVRLQASAADMEQTVRHARALARATRGDFAIRSRHETASGETTITVARSSNLLILAAIVAGIILLLIFRG